MIKYLIGTAAAVFLIAGAATSAKADCGLSNSKLAHGWTCDVQTSQEAGPTIYVQDGNSSNCQSFASIITVTTATAYNPGGHETSTTTSDSQPVQTGHNQGNGTCP